MQLQKEKELIEKKMQRIEKAKGQEVAELREKLEASQGAVIEQLKVKDDKIKEVRQRMMCDVTLIVSGHTDIFA